jgi:hypothetical protein
MWKWYGKYGRNTSWNVKFLYSTYFSSILSKFYHNSSYFSSVFSLSYYYSSCLSSDLENTDENSEKIWKIWKKGKSNSDKIWKIWKKRKLNSNKIWKVWKKNKLYGIKVIWILKCYFLRTSPFTGYLPLPTHFIFIITLFISIIIFLTKFCHHFNFQI